MRLFADRGFLVDNVVLFLLSICFVPLFFFASLYAQIGLGESAGNAGLVLLVFFGGFTIGAQNGGRILDKRGARPSVVPGCAVAAVGFWLWGESLDKLSFGEQWYYLAIAGLGVGLVLGPVSTDALNRAARATYGAVTGLTQTVRNFGGSLGLAVLGSILITETISHVRDGLTHAGVPKAQAESIAHSVSSASSGGSGGGSHPAASHAITHQIQLGFAHATQTVVYGMAGAMALAFIVALRAMPSGRAGEAVETVEAADADARHSPAAPLPESGANAGATPAGA
jgi:fucose permease